MQPGKLWQAVLGEIELSVSRGNYLTWFKPSRLLQADSEAVIIGVPNIFVRQQLDRKYGTLIKQTLAKNGIIPAKIEYKMISKDAAKASADPVSDVPLEAEPAVAAKVPSTPASNSPSSPTSPNRLDFTQPARTAGPAFRQALNSRYTFDSFIVGSGNELAYAACQAIAASPGTKYNPLFLYGGVGIGKTHLMQAVGNAMLANKPGSRIVYVSSEQFLQEFVSALRFKKISDFTETYRSADILIVDDVQFLAGKEKAQEEFFHTFNTLHQANKQIIISSDKPPSDINGLEDRLRSRFVWGMSIDMQIPDYETRCAILQTKAGSSGLELPIDVTEYLAGNIQTNIRELEGALNQLLAFCEMRGLQPNLAIASGMVGPSTNSRGRPKHISAKQVIERTAKHFQITVDEILSAKRDKDIVMPRQVAMYILRSELKLSFPKIAKELGRKDHTTAIHSVDKIEKEQQIDDSIREAINEIKELLYA